MAQKFTGPGNPLEKAGSKVGISFNNNRKIYETGDAHRVIEWVKQTAHHKHNDVMEVMFKKYFEDGADITDHKVLLSIVDAVGGLDVASCQRLLSGSEMTQEVDRGIDQARRMGISGVPFFVLQRADTEGQRSRPVTLEGAQPPEVLQKALTSFAK
eukprot:TRINITY_DN30488_c0_g2_i1.p1 TRINITY_DN30488_c0_g2~~TRINITY_DN30488_c0_g2_i1.p1  ORF type:complete len:156 (-),score=26.84 TRINITY_DN30488_c0_g2_i1:297-764(-)